MRLVPLIFGLLLLIPASLGCAQSGDAATIGEDPEWIAFETAMADTGASSRKIMVFVYTEWCGFCRRMFGTTFKDETVLGYLDQKFASVRINAEGNGEVALAEQTLTEAQVAQAMGVSGYPTIIFLDETGGYITRLPGYLPPEDYIDVLTFIGDDHYKSESFEEHLAHEDG